MKHFTSILLIFFLISCGNSNPIPAKKMEQIMWDIALGNNYMNNYVMMKHPGINRGAANNEMLADILKKHNVSIKDFNKSITIYLKNDTKSFERILDSIATKQSRKFENYKKEKAHYDSLLIIKDSTRIKKDSLKLKDSLSKKSISKDSLPEMEPVLREDSAKIIKNPITKKKTSTKKKSKKKKQKKSKKTAQ